MSEELKIIARRLSFVECIKRASLSGMGEKICVYVYKYVYKRAVDQFKTYLELPVNILSVGDEEYTGLWNDI